MVGTQLVTPWIGALAASIDEQDIVWIARADYGDQEDEYSAALRAVRADPGTIELSTFLNAQEVLNLVRWHTVGEPSRWDDPLGDAVEIDRQHRCRLFCSIALLLAACRADSSSFIHSVNESLITALDSIAAIHEEWMEAFGHWCDALAKHLIHPEEEAPFVPLAAFLACASSPAPSPPRVRMCIDSIEASISAVDIAGQRYAPAIGRFSHLIDLSRFNQRRAMWETHIDRAHARFHTLPTCQFAADWLSNYAKPPFA